jgi:diadenosine tetraphosphate (Ap4A) HIT family hydrolase
MDWCTFCDRDGFRRDSVVFAENDFALFGNLEDGGPLSGSGVIVPRAHRATVFDLSADEFAATFTLLRVVQPLLVERYNPDGFNVGWNCYGAGGQDVPHAHLHVLLRFGDEPRSGYGIRWWLRQPENTRPDPEAPGTGRRDFDVVAHRRGV